MNEKKLRKGKRRKKEEIKINEKNWRKGRRKKE